MAEDVAFKVGSIRLYGWKAKVAILGLMFVLMAAPALLTGVLLMQSRCQ